MIGYIKFENEIKIGDIELDFFKNKMKYIIQLYLQEKMAVEKQQF